MLEVYTGRDLGRFPALSERMYRQRFEIYVKRRKWKGLTPMGGLEKDQYDTSQATYLLALDDEDDILAALRLLPTTGPHILGDLFPHLAPEGVPRGEDILELTRFYVAPFGAGKAVRTWLIGVLCAGLIEHCLATGVRQITSVIDTFLLKLMQSMEWDVRLLGPSRDYGEGEAVAVIVEMSEKTLESTRRTKGVRGPVLSRHLPSIARIPAIVRHSPASLPGELVLAERHR